MAQITEHVFRKSLNKYRETMWFLKLQVLPMTFTKSPADFLILTENYRYLTEVKEIDCRYVKKAFRFDRVTQLKELQKFEKAPGRNKSYILIMFRYRMLKDSYAFMIPVNKFVSFKHALEKKSGNLSDFMEAFEDNRLSTKKSMFNLGKWLE